MYGIGEFSLAQDLHISVKEAKAYIESYLEKYHGVRNYMESIKEQAKKDGYVKTMLNRIRYIPELKSPNYNIRQFGERVALNTPVSYTHLEYVGRMCGICCCGIYVRRGIVISNVVATALLYLNIRNCRKVGLFRYFLAVNRSYTVITAVSAVLIFNPLFHHIIAFF